VLSLIAIDPGMSAGIAMFDHREFLVRVFTSKHPHAPLREVLLANADVLVVCERAPRLRRRQPSTTEFVEALVARFANKRVDVRPTDWKGHPGARLMRPDYDAASTVHERDAVSIGRWFNNWKRNGGHYQVKTRAAA